MHICRSYKQLVSVLRCGRYFHLVVVADINICLAAAAGYEIIKLNLNTYYTKDFLQRREWVKCFGVHVCNTDFSEAGVQFSHCWKYFSLHQTVLCSDAVTEASSISKCMSPLINEH